MSCEGGGAMSCMEPTRCLEVRGREVNFDWIFFAWVLLDLGETCHE